MRRSIRPSNAYKQRIRGHSAAVIVSARKKAKVGLGGATRALRRHLTLQNRQ